MIRVIFNFCVALLFIVTMQSCTIAKVSGKGAVPLLLNQPTEKMQFMEHVTIKKNRNFDYTNTFDVAELLSKEIEQKET